MTTSFLPLRQRIEIGWLLGLLASLFLAVTAGCQRAEGGSDPAASLKIGVVDVGPMVKDLRLSAPIRNDDAVDVYSTIEGPVAEVYVQAGQMVKTGEPLIKIDDEEAQADVQRTALKLEDARCDAKTASAPDETPERKRKLEIAIELAELDRARAQRALSRHVVRAPREGKLEKIAVAVGDFVGVKGAFNQGTKVASIVGDNVFKIYVVASERDVPLIHLKQTAEVGVDAIPGLEAVGQVVEIQTTPEPGMGAPSFPVAIRFRTLSPAIKLGMTGSVTMRLAEVKSCLRVPVQAVRLAAEQPYVILLGAGETERRCDVRLGLDDGGKVEVTGDLRAGDRVRLL